MGGIKAAEAAITVAKEGKSILDTINDSKRAYNQTKQERLNAYQTKRNLLDKQLATQRARLGALGLNSSGSANAVQKGLLIDSYRDILIEDDDYNRRLKQIKRDKRRFLTDKAINYVGKTVSSYSKADSSNSENIS